MTNHSNHYNVRNHWLKDAAFLSALPLILGNEVGDMLFRYSLLITYWKQLQCRILDKTFMRNTYFIREFMALPSEKKICPSVYTMICNIFFLGQGWKKWGVDHCASADRWIPFSSFLGLLIKLFSLSLFLEQTGIKCSWFSYYSQKKPSFLHHFSTKFDWHWNGLDHSLFCSHWFSSGSSQRDFTRFQSIFSSSMNNNH